MPQQKHSNVFFNKFCTFYRSQSIETQLSIPNVKTIHLWHPPIKLFKFWATAIIFRKIWYWLYAAGNKFRGIRVINRTAYIEKLKLCIVQNAQPIASATEHCIIFLTCGNKIQVNQPN